MRRLIEIRKDPAAGETFARAEAGLTLAELAETLSRHDWENGPRMHYPVDPTESTASVGGTVATDASGSRSLRCGPTRDWVRALRVVLADGRLVSFARGEVRAEAGLLRWPEVWGNRGLEVPELRRPEGKSAAGYFLAPDVDLVDLLVGSEGTLGVVAEVELALAPEPENVLALVCFLPRTASGLALVRALKSERRLSSLAIEYFDATALDLLRDERAAGQEEKIPELPAGAGSAVLLEQEYADEGGLEAAVEAIDGLLVSHGGSLDETWAGETDAERERMRLLRHGVPEAVNGRIARLKRELPEIHKVGTDLAFPDPAAEEMERIYSEMLPASGLEYVLFGHAGENHLHANFLPRTGEELDRARALHEELARAAVALGGAVTGEHGVGRLKRGLLEIQYGKEGVAALRTIKDFFDPDGRLNPGVMFERRR
jgi:D-lactate dehydrogenase (cytochrome)